jgi:hypothetical protein
MLPAAALDAEPDADEDAAVDADDAELDEELDEELPQAASNAESEVAPAKPAAPLSAVRRVIRGTSMSSKPLMQELLLSHSQRLVRFLPLLHGLRNCRVFDLR